MDSTNGSCYDSVPHDTHSDQFLRCVHRRQYPEKKERKGETKKAFMVVIYYIKVKVGTNINSPKYLHMQEYLLPSAGFLR